MSSPYQSWGRFPEASHEARPIFWRGYEQAALISNKTVLPFGLGRSYGDVCLNNGGIIIPTRGLNRLISFDPETGILRCEAGVSLAEIIDFAIPRGYFLPVTPGTKIVTIAGAVANDVHGKNHHKSGTFGRHVNCFELLRSDGTRLICSSEENPELFAATIGGIGLTGLITWVELRLRPINNRLIDTVSIKFKNLDDFYRLSDKYENDFEYTVSWIDCMAGGKSLGRGIFMAGNHASKEYGSKLEVSGKAGGPVIPIEFPGFVLNSLSIRLFNLLYYNKQIRKKKRMLVDIDPFFYPLDSIDSWNRVYGKCGPLQYQCVVPAEDSSIIRSILQKIASSGLGSFLAVLKMMVDISSPGMLSFPKKGVTLALDFPVKGQKTFGLFKELDKIVRESGGRLYTAKDACMSAEDFKVYYPNWGKFSEYVDPGFSSSMWRRLTGK
jgi:FAD/FMN-containing dehydrogenase